MTVDLLALTKVGYDLLVAIGEDPNREGLRETPDRFARAWAEFIDYDPGKVDQAFEQSADEMVVVSGINVWSLCEHHLLPFSAAVAIGYVPRGHVLGLSKFARIAHGASHRLQLQERLVLDIADAVSKVTNSPDVAVVADGAHLCMAMRGIRTPASMRTSVTRGLFRNDARARSEFLMLVNGHNGR